MSLVTGPITRHGAIVDVLVGVSQNRQRLLEKNNFPVPERVPLRAIIGRDVLDHCVFTYAGPEKVFHLAFTS
jgi:hypothetical protein